VYASEIQVPPVNEYDISKGFTYMYLNEPPLFPFGYGLSYTKFKYDNLKLSTNTITTSGTVTVTLDIQNTGKRAGDEVPQLYVHQVKSIVRRPVEALQGFQRLSLERGEKKSVSFTLPAEKLAYWDETSHGFVVEPGVFELMVGASSSDLRLKTQITVVK
jgi:beta-glucosidase